MQFSVEKVPKILTHLQRRWAKWSKEADPFTILSINPSRISHVTIGTSETDRVYDGDEYPDYTHDSTPDAGMFSSHRAGDIVGGEWDRKTISFEKYVPYTSMQEHFENGTPWEDTRLYSNITESISAGKEFWGCATEAEFRNERCEYIDELYGKIEANGYLSQRELNQSNGQTDAYHEVEINVARDGSLLFNDGKHRLSIAKLLDIEEIPVRVIVRHPERPIDEPKEDPEGRGGF